MGIGGEASEKNVGAYAPDYRREIDGLRALAVIPVILFHAGFDAFKGGYVGVDVFFVISGYLITTIILADARDGAFSIARFYERRVRRILPALFLVLLVTFLLSFYFLLPGDMKENSASLAAVPLFVSNILFWSESGYFANAVELKPLIHTWSLAVEEQFYLFYPILFIFLWRHARRRLGIILLVGTLVSLGLAQWAAFNKPEANFYLLPTRAWELGIGALAALYLSRPAARPAPAPLKEIAGALGLAAISVAVLRYDNYTPFPSLYALAPTVGTALIILFASEKTLVGKALGAPPLVFVGLISYSAYLWHQPIFAFARHRSFHEPTSVAFALLSMLALALALLSWRFVEQPFRRREFLTRRRIFTAAVLCSVLFISVGAMGVATNGYYGRSALRAEIGAFEAAIEKNQGLGSGCDGWFDEAPACASGAAPTILLWGDSYGMHLVQGLLASNPDAHFVQITASMCGPIIGVAPIDRDYSRAWAKQCIAHNDRVLDWLKRTPEITHVVMSSEYSQYAAPFARYLNRAGKASAEGTDADAQVAETAAALAALGKVPVFVTPTPQDGRNLGRCLLKAKRFGADATVCDFSHDDWRAARPHVFTLFEKLRRDYAVIDLGDAICSEGICRVSDGETPIYRDLGHLSPDGSAIVGARLDLYRRIVEAKAPQR